MLLLWILWNSFIWFLGQVSTSQTESALGTAVGSGGEQFLTESSAGTCDTMELPSAEQACSWGISFQLIIIFPPAFSSWHCSLFAAVCVLVWHTEPQNSCKSSQREEKKGECKVLSSWGNLLAEEKQRGSSKTAIKDREIRVADWIVGVGPEFYKAFFIHGMSCQDVVRQIGPTKCFMCLSQEAALNFFPTDGDGFMDVTYQVD